MYVTKSGWLVRGGCFISKKDTTPPQQVFLFSNDKVLNLTSEVGGYLNKLEGLKMKDTSDFASSI